LDELVVLEDARARKGGCAKLTAAAALDFEAGQPALGAEGARVHFQDFGGECGSLIEKRAQGRW
jgi:hypothetical protein